MKVKNLRTALDDNSTKIISLRDRAWQLNTLTRACILTTEEAAKIYLYEVNPIRLKLGLKAFKLSDIKKIFKTTY